MPYRLATPQRTVSKRRSETKMGWIVGLEPTTSRATIWHSSQLNYIHHAACVLLALPAESRRVMPLARLQGFEPGTYGLEGRCSILLSYRRRPEFRNLIIVAEMGSVNGNKHEKYEFLYTGQHSDSSVKFGFSPIFSSVSEMASFHRISAPSPVSS